MSNKLVEAFKNEPSKTCGRQPLKSFTWSFLEYLDPNMSKKDEEWIL